VLAYEGIGVCRSSWGKWVQGAPGIFEFRVRHDAATILRQHGLRVPEELKEGNGEILLRVFRCQNIEIKRAKQRLTRWKAEQDHLAKPVRPSAGRISARSRACWSKHPRPA
jgi:hypothetical protein